MYLAELSIAYCMKVRNLTQDDVKERLEHLRSFSDELFFSWETFELLQNGTRVLQNTTESTALAMIVDPEEEVMPFRNWKTIWEVDDHRFRYNNPEN